MKNKTFKSIKAMINLEEIRKYTTITPKNENEMLVCLSALTLLNALVKIKEYKGIVTYGQFKPKVTKLINYVLAHPEIKLVDEIYIDTTNPEANCLYVRCLGVQFSYHGIPINGILIDFINSMDNIYMVYDQIRKQPRALGVFKFAVKCMESRISDREFINKEIENIEIDFPEVYERKNKAVKEPVPIDIDNKDELRNLFSAKYKVK